MIIAHLTVSASSRGGGIPEVIRALTLAAADRGCQSVTVALQDDGFALGPWVQGSPVLLPSRSVVAMRWAPEMDRFLVKCQPELVHSHGLWSYASRAAATWGCRERRPWVVSPHGMLEPWALAQGRWKKLLAAPLLEHRHLREAKCLHALCPAEAQSMRAYGLTNPIAIVPNGVDLLDQGQQTTSTEGRQKILLFLGRLHPKKGLVDALRAWQQRVSSPQGEKLMENWIFAIAGWDQGGHEEELKRLCAELRLPHCTIPAADLRQANEESLLPHGSVVFTGAAFGSTKSSLLSGANAFVLPSFSEGLPMAVLEAWSHGLPVVLTPECNLPEGVAAGAALEIATQQGDRPSAIQSALDRLMGMSQSERQHMGAMGRRLVETHYSWTKVAGQLSEVYKWILGRGPQPRCVVLSS